MKFAAAHIFIAQLEKNKKRKDPELIQFHPRHVFSIWFLTFSVDFCSWLWRCSKLFEIVAHVGMFVTVIFPAI